MVTAARIKLAEMGRGPNFWKIIIFKNKLTYIVTIKWYRQELKEIRKMRDKKVDDDKHRWAFRHFVRFF